MICSNMHSIVIYLDDSDRNVIFCMLFDVIMHCYESKFNLRVIFCIHKQGYLLLLINADVPGLRPFQSMSDGSFIYCVFRLFSLSFIKAQNIYI